MLALTFPGQGSQFVGMGRDLANSYPESRAVFDEVNEALNQKLSALMWEGDENELKLTANAQPALMSVSLAVIKALESKGFQVKNSEFVAGHSLGEYSALAAAHSLSIFDTARLLRIRGNAMQEAVPVGLGAMAAIIGLQEEKLELICELVSSSSLSCQIANDNGGGQLVISGNKLSVDKACEMAREYGAKQVLLLPVSAPFHSSLMEPAAQIMAEALEKISINPTIVPLISNVSAKPISDPDDIKKRLVEQVTGRVRWNESIRFMCSKGIRHIWEIGPGKVLSRLIRRIDHQIETRTIGDSDDINQALKSIS
ncbi:ACP S-malonyltransferase [Candidatus Endowatersipora endosymbiont of Watersipora subatra]|uniref:ACP S-malonyltransferase n=1 Tax=Candidatus Endowatersipora endosymbiont of Watersipora subatra TaxID=3077946 RepID=UPI00312CB302